MASIDIEEKTSISRKKRIERESSKRRREDKSVHCVFRVFKKPIEHGIVNRTGSRDIIVCRQSRLSVI